MDGINVAAALLVLAVCVGMAVFGTVLAGSALKTWYPSLAKPRFQIPTALFAAVGAVVYVLDAIVLYRLIDRLDSSESAPVAIVAVLVVMLYNELWNGALFRLRSPFAAWIGLLGFLAPLSIMLVAVALVDLLASVLMAAYAVWVVAYDLPWMYRLWKLNPSPGGEQLSGQLTGAEEPVGDEVPQPRGDGATAN